jgi:hypothetical protein
MLFASLATLGAALQPLPAPKLDRGACAIFVWSKTEARGPLVVLAGTPPVARIRRDGRLKMLPRQGEPARAGHQVFQGLGLRLELNVAVGNGPVLSGALAPAGVLSFSEGDGEAVVIPVTAAAVCDD